MARIAVVREGLRAREDARRCAGRSPLLVALVLIAISPPLARAFCGDGAVDPGERCDDGNTADGDGCSALCIPECALSPTLCDCVRTPTGELRRLCVYADPGCIAGTPLDLPGCSRTLRAHLEHRRRRLLKRVRAAELYAQQQLDAGRPDRAIAVLRATRLRWMPGTVDTKSPACRAAVLSEMTLLLETDLFTGLGGPCMR